MVLKPQGLIDFLNEIRDGSEEKIFCGNPVEVKPKQKYDCWIIDNKKVYPVNQHVVDHGFWRALKILSDVSVVTARKIGTLVVEEGYEIHDDYSCYYGLELFLGKTLDLPDKEFLPAGKFKAEIFTGRNSPDIKTSYKVKTIIPFRYADSKKYAALIGKKCFINSA